MADANEQKDETTTVSSDDEGHACLLRGKDGKGCTDKRRPLWTVSIKGADPVPIHGAGRPDKAEDCLAALEKSVVKAGGTLADLRFSKMDDLKDIQKGNRAKAKKEEVKKTNKKTEDAAVSALAKLGFMQSHKDGGNTVLKDKLVDAGFEAPKEEPKPVKKGIFSRG